MSTMYEESRPQRQRGAVFNANAIGGAWAEHVVKTAKLVVSQNQTMAPGQATSCQMAWGHTAYDGSSSSGYHGEIDCLDQAHTADETLSAGTFQSLSNPVCLVCCSVLYAVGITTVPAKASGAKEYGNYSLPGWVFDDDAPDGILSSVLGRAAYEAWMKLSDEARKKADNRSELIKQMVALLHKYV